VREGGRYPNATKGESCSCRITGLMRLTFFHTEYGIPSGPGAEEGENLKRASLISSSVRGVATPAGQGLRGGEEIVQKGGVDCDWVRSVGEGREPGGFAQGDQLLGRPDVVRRGFCNQSSPVGGFCSLDGFEVAELGLSRSAVGVGGLHFFHLLGRLS